MCRFSAVHLFLFDVDSHHWLSGLPQEVTEKCVSSLTTCKIDSSCCNKHFLIISRITVHDGFSDPLGWDTNKTPSPLIHLNNCSAQSLIDRLGDKPLRDDRAVVIDSLSPLLLHQSPAVVCRMIHAVGELNTTVLLKMFEEFCYYESVPKFENCLLFCHNIIDGCVHEFTTSVVMMCL